MALDLELVYDHMAGVVEKHLADHSIGSECYYNVKVSPVFTVVYDALTEAPAKLHADIRELMDDNGFYIPLIVIPNSLELENA